MDEKSLRTLEYDKVLARLAGYTSFSAGEALALALEPTSSAAAAERWQSETQEARRLLDTRSDVTIGGARDVRRPAANAQRGYILQPEELLDVQATLTAGRELRRKLERSQAALPHLWAIADLIEECPGVVAAIGETLDERGDVLDSASPRLASIRRDLRAVHGRIQEKLRALLNSSASQYLQEPLITTRAGRYVVPLIADHKGRIKGVVHDQSGSGATLWIEPLNTVELNNEWRELQLAEEEEIQRILGRLSAMVGEQAEPIIRVVERLAELDLVLARARYANATAAVEPELTPWRERERPQPDGRGRRGAPPAAESLFGQHPGSTIWIRGARHPLLDPAAVVPTDLLLDEDTYIVLITGPNTGGKTVSLKTVGLMALMAQAGLHLPAAEARLTVFQNVFADIGDEQSIEQNLSTFSGHLTNITRILGQVDERSLVLLDELGSGTDPAEGAALAQAIVSFLRDKGATTFVATHFPELKSYATQTLGATNASLLFDVESLMPTYQMTIGMPGRSNAFAIARRLGLEETILEEALRLVGAGSQRAESLLDSIYQLREKILAQEAGTRLALRHAEEEREALRSQLRQIDAQRQHLLDEARQTAEAELEEIRDEIRSVRRKLRDAESLNKLKKLQKETEALEEVERFAPTDQPAGTDEGAPAAKRRRRPAGLQVGDTVLVKGLGARGQVLSLERNEAIVAAGRLTMRARLEDLELKEREQEPLPAEAGRRPAPVSPGIELDIRGQRVEEGLAALEAHLEAAFLADLPWVRIIHGKGTGRLREAIRQALAASQHVKSWEEGRDGEGGAGVTVAKLDIG